MLRTDAYFYILVHVRSHTTGHSKLMFMLVINVKHCGNPSTSAAVQTASTKKHRPKLLRIVTSG